MSDLTALVAAVGWWASLLVPVGLIACATRRAWERVLGPSSTDAAFGPSPVVERVQRQLAPAVGSVEYLDRLLNLPSYTGCND